MGYYHHGGIKIEYKAGDIRVGVELLQAPKDSYINDKQVADMHAALLVALEKAVELTRPQEEVIKEAAL